jgi:flagella basal body P-ring formation protein FlgA
MRKFLGYIVLNLMLISSPAIAAEAVAPSTTPTIIPQQNYIFNISYEDAEGAISKALSEKATGGQIVSAIISGKKSTPLFSYNKPINVEVRGLRADSSKNSWSASLVILSEDAVISAMPLAGRYALMVEVPTLKNAIKNGDLISDADIEIKQFAIERVHGDNIKDSADLIGKTAIRTISPSRPIRTSEISFPALVKKNAIVQMRYKTGNIEITTTGQALSDGAKGDVIEVKNTTSKKSTRAVVFDEHTVDVMSQGVPSNAK